MNLGHFCDPDPERNPYPNPIRALDLSSRQWQMYNREFPIHEMCSGKEVINFGLETELIVNCDCVCHLRDRIFSTL
jgi:hypothetical protein